MKSPLQKIEYDKSVDALYIYANSGKVHKTLILNDRVMFDVDKKGKIIGIEVLDASKPWLAKKNYQLIDFTKIKKDGVNIKQVLNRI